MSTDAFCKETHAFDDALDRATIIKRPELYTRFFSSMRFCGMEDSPAPSLSDSQGCYAARFLEATPQDHNIAFFPTLRTAMPPALLSSARFALILREPIARFVSQYNHVRHALREAAQATGTGMNIYSLMTQAKSSGDAATACSYATPTFAMYADCMRSAGAVLGGVAVKEGYLSFINSALGAIKRSQLLILDYDLVTGGHSSEPRVGGTTTAMRALTQHYGLPVLRNVSSLTRLDEHEHAAKIEVTSYLCPRPRPCACARPCALTPTILRDPRTFSAPNHP